MTDLRQTPKSAREPSGVSAAAAAAATDTAAATEKTPARRKPHKTHKTHRKRDAIEQFILNSSNQTLIVKSSLSQLRYMILVDGLGYDDPIKKTCSYRVYVWSILLRTPPYSTNDYLALVGLGPSPSHTKICNDSFRTLATDAEFHAKVRESQIIRLLNAYAWNRHAEQKSGEQRVLQNRANGLQGRKEAQTADPPAHRLSPYVQGMNVLAAPFLYVCRSEVEAFALFETLLLRDIPLYVEPTLEGVHTALMLVDICLSIVDSKLYEFLRSRFLKAELYAFASILTLSACTPPLSELLVLWDFQFAYGTHLNVLYIIAQLILMRSDLLACGNGSSGTNKSPMSLLRQFPRLNAKEIIKLAISFIPSLPADVYDMLCRHGYDPNVKQEAKAWLDKMGA